MHKFFYASGFLYHSPSQQILLRHTPSFTDTSFSLFIGQNNNGEDSPTVFQRIILEILGLSIHPSRIQPVYDYFHEKHKKEHYVHYAEISDTKDLKKLKRNNSVAWVSLQYLSKVKLSEQIRHDITIGQRVIRASEDQKIISITPQK